MCATLVGLGVAKISDGCLCGKSAMTLRAGFGVRLWCSGQARAFLVSRSWVRIRRGSFFVLFEISSCAWRGMHGSDHMASIAEQLCGDVPGLEFGELRKNANVVIFVKHGKCPNLNLGHH